MNVFEHLNGYFSMGNALSTEHKAKVEVFNSEMKLVKSGYAHVDIKLNENTIVVKLKDKQYNCALNYISFEAIELISFDKHPNIIVFVVELTEVPF